MSDQRDRVARLLSPLGTVDGPVSLMALMPDGSIATQIGGKPVAWAIADALHAEGLKVVTRESMVYAHHAAFCEPWNPFTKEGHIEPSDLDERCGHSLFDSIDEVDDR